MLPNLGPGELLGIMVIALIVFGPKKLPEIGRGIGNALREFNKARNDFMETINSEMNEDDRRPTSSYQPSALEASTDVGDRPTGRVEYPAPLEEDNADALPYGGDFSQPAGDSQPQMRTAWQDDEPEHLAAGDPSGTLPVNASTASATDGDGDDRKA